MHRRKHANKIKTLLFLFLIFAAVSLKAHFNWIAPLNFDVKPGETASFSLNHGHTFPLGEETPDLDYIKAFVIVPSGEKNELYPEKREESLVVSFPLKETGRHIIYFEEDRGVRSRTPRGWQEGGKDKYPEATMSMRFYSSSLVYLHAGVDKGEEVIPLGLPFELAGYIKNNTLTVAVFKDKLPIEDIEITMVKENTEPEVIGKTDKNGSIEYDLSGLHGRLLFIASCSKSMSADANYKEDRAASTVYLWID